MPILNLSHKSRLNSREHKNSFRLNTAFKSFVVNFSSVLSRLCSIQIFHSSLQSPIYDYLFQLHRCLIIFILSISKHFSGKFHCLTVSFTSPSRFIHKNSWNWFFWVSSDPFKQFLKRLCVVFWITGRLVDERDLGGWPGCTFEVILNMQNL